MSSQWLRQETLDHRRRNQSHDATYPYESTAVGTARRDPRMSQAYPATREEETAGSQPSRFQNPDGGTTRRLSHPVDVLQRRSYEMCDAPYAAGTPPDRDLPWAHETMVGMRRASPPDEWSDRPRGAGLKVNLSVYDPKKASVDTFLTQIRVLGRSCRWTNEEMAAQALSRVGKDDLDVFHLIDESQPTKAGRRCEGLPPTF